MKTRLLLIILITIISACNKEEDESCGNIVCGPNETCIDNICRCPENYRGISCRDQIPPKEILIHNIEILRYPSSANWDNNDGPDLYITIYQAATPVWKLPMVIQNATDNPPTIMLSPPASITRVSDQHTITMYDDDGMLVDQFMAGVLFTPYSDTSGFPTKIIADTRGLVAYELELSYCW